jgi:hypothetical protein
MSSDHECEWQTSGAILRGECGADACMLDVLAVAQQFRLKLRKRLAEVMPETGETPPTS